MEAVTISNYFSKFHCEGEQRDRVVAVWEYRVKGGFFIPFYSLTWEVRDPTVV